MLAFSPRMAELAQRVHGRWFPRVEILQDGREHVRDWKEGMQQGNLSPASSLEFDDTGAVRLVPTALQDIAFATGAANFGGLIDDLTVNQQRILLYELAAGRDPLQITKATLRLHRKPNGSLPTFDGSFVLMPYIVTKAGTGAFGSGGTIVLGNGFELTPVSSPVEVLASNVSWTADVAEVDFVFPTPGIDVGMLLQGTDRPAGKYHVAFVLVLGRGSNSNAAWINDAAQTSGEATTAGKGTLSWWNMDRAGFVATIPGYGQIVVPGQNKPSAGGWFRVSESNSLGRAAVSVRSNTVARATIEFKPTVVVARKSSSGADPPPSVARLGGLGYAVTKNLTADVATCRGFDVVVIDCDAWSLDEHDAFIRTLLVDGQHVIVCGNDSTTGNFFATAAHSTSIHTPNKTGAATKLVDHAVWEAVTTMPDDTDSGLHITALASLIATAYGAYANDAAAYSVIEATDPASPPNAAGLLLFVPRLTLTGNDSDRFFRNAVDYMGRKDVDLQRTPTGDVEFVGKGDTPGGSLLVFEVWDGANWVGYVDGDRATVELPTVPKKRSYYVRATLQGSADGLRSPILRAVGAREIVATDVSSLVSSGSLPDTFYQVSDLVGCKSEVAELPLRIVRHGATGDAEDLISRIVSGAANPTSMHARFSMAAGGTNVGPTGAAMYFPGRVTTSWVKKTSVVAFPTVNLTWAAWFKVRRQDMLASTGCGILSYSKSPQNNSTMLFLQRGDDLNRFDIAINDVTVSTPTNWNADDGQWHRALFTWTSAGGVLKFYLDGIQRWQTVVASGASVLTGGAFYVGQDQDSEDGGLDANQAMLGSVDDVRVWSRALSASEAADDFRGVSVGTNLVLRWSFDGRTRDTVTDDSGTGNTGTGSGTGIDLEPAPPWAAIGVPRQYELHIDTYRIDDYLPSEAAIDLTCVSALDRLKLPIPRRKIVGGNWVVDPARYDAPAGHTITSVAQDVRDGQLGLASRYAGSLPQGGPFDRTGTRWNLIQGQIGAPGIGTAGKTEIAKDVLEQLGRISGGAWTTIQGRIHYRDLFGDKEVVAHFSEAEITWDATAPGLRQRAPRVLISFQPTTLGGKDWTKSIEREDAVIVAAIEQAGTEAGTVVDEFPDDVSRWLRVSAPTSLTDSTTDNAEGIADALAHRHVKQFGSGILSWGFSCRIPHPHIEIGDMVEAEISKFVGRDAVLSRELRGPMRVRAVVVGRNLWGTKFQVWIRAYNAIDTTSRMVSRRGSFQPLVVAVVEDVDGRPDQARVRLRSNPDSSEVTIRYKVISAVTDPPERSTDGAVWTTYSGPFIVSRDPALIQRLLAWGDWLGSWGPREIVEIANDRRPQILSLTLANAHVDIAHQDVAHQDVAHGDTGHGDSHTDTGHQDTHGDTHSDATHFDQPESRDDGLGHCDVGVINGSICQQHGDEGHGDTHTDSHTDAGHVDSHSDAAHADGAHTDAHTDGAHGDGNYGIGVAAQADADTGSVRIGARKTADPTAADVRTMTSVDGRNVVISLIDIATGLQIVLNPGDTAYIGGLAYSRAAAVGVEGPLMLARGSRYTVAAVGTDLWVPG